MNTPVTKKNIVRRIAYVSKYFILVIFIFGFGWDLLHVRNVSYEKRIEIYLGSAATLAGILFVWVYIWVQKKKVIKLIQRQEECLNVDFDADMKGITMCGGKVGTVEVVACGDWYVLLSEVERLVINRRYIADVRDVYKQEKYLGRGLHWQITIVFDTIDDTPFRFRLSDAEQVIIDLCEWLGHPMTEIREGRKR